MSPTACLEEDRTSTNRTAIGARLEDTGIAILPPIDVEDSLALLKALKIFPTVTMLDPWYNKGFGGVRADYVDYVLKLVSASAEISQHVFLWGFPEIVARFVDKIPDELILVSWLTWFYKNNPSVIRGWRSSQNACLHLSKPGATLYPEHFLNEAQKQKQIQGKLRYMPGPTSVIEADLTGSIDVIEAPLMVGFVHKNQQTGHPSQKPLSVFERLYLMTTHEDDLIFDPMSGSGTSGEFAKLRKRKAILADHSEDYTQIAEKRLGVQRIQLSDSTA